MSAGVDETVRVGAVPRPGGVRELIGLALPVILTNLSQTLMMAIDAAMVGRLGASALGAVGYGGIWYWTAMSAFSGAATGVQTFVAQAHGSAAHERCGRWAWQGWYAIVPIATLAIGAFAFGFDELLDVLRPDAALRPQAIAYVQARVVGVPGLMTALVLSSFFRGIGDTRTPLYAMVTANIVNLVLNYALIFGHFGLPAWGVAGSGIATAVAEWVQAGWLCAVFFGAAMRRRYHTAPSAPDVMAIRRFTRTSAPIGGQWVLDMLAFAVFSTLVARMGTSEMAASQALISLMHLSFMTVIGVQMAVATMVGRYIGAGNFAAAERSHASAVRVGLSLACAVAALFLLAPEFCLRLFTSDPDVVRLGIPLLAVGAAFGITDAIGLVSGGALRGAGDTRWPFLVQTSFAWGVFLPSAYLFGVTLGGGLSGAWLGGVLYLALLGAALQWRFRSGVWRRVRL
ncbi:MAG: MATE family efflux transporter [Candidatus Binatia bacterium]